MVRVMSAAMVAASCLLVSTAAYAQGAGQAPAGVVFDAQAPAPYVPPVRATVIRAYGFLDMTALAASRTFDAVIGTSRVSMAGGGVDLTVWKGLFARAAFSSTRESGSRVIVIDDEVIPIGIPLTVEMTPLEIGGGVRFGNIGSGRVVPYVGAAWLRLGYHETSDFGLASDDSDETFTGVLGFAGIEARLVSWVMAGAEVQYRTVPDAIGGGGVSEAFGESDLGGVTVRVLVGIRR